MERYYLTFGGGGHLRVRNCRRNQTDKKMRHNNDIAACEGNGCPMRTTCLRWQLGQTMDDYHWYISIYDPSHCEYYIHNKPNNDNNNGKGN